MTLGKNACDDLLSLQLRANPETEKKPGEICARLTSSINVYGRGSTPPLMPQAIDR